MIVTKKLPRVRNNPIRAVLLLYLIHNVAFSCPTTRIKNHIRRYVVNDRLLNSSLASEIFAITPTIGFYYGITRDLLEEAFGPSSDETVHHGNDRKDREREFKLIGKKVEDWANRILAEDPLAGKNSWQEIQCVMPNKFNPDRQTIQHVKWMPDSREEKADPENKRQNHPCMRLHSVIDAPFPIVCRYLSQEKRYKEYNSLLVDQKDVEELTPHSKICWSQSKKLLFIEPRDFVTFCSHRWLRDGTQLVVSQACDHPDYPLNEGFRAYSLRAATYIMPDDSSSGSKTKIIMLAHCNCGKDLPEWAIRSAVKLLAPIKPFEIIHRINVGIAASRKELEAEEEANAMKMKKSSSRLRKKKNSKKLGRSRSSRPAGIAQMGYGCFWPNGGGKIER